MQELYINASPEQTVVFSSYIFFLRKGANLSAFGTAPFTCLHCEGKGGGGRGGGKAC